MTNNLQLALDEQADKIPREQLVEAAKNISLRYRTREKAAGAHFIQSPAEALAYAVARMPATYGAVHSALAYTLEALGDIRLNTLTDAGAGTGAATWAASDLLDLSLVTCLEYDGFMKALGEKLMQTDAFLKNASWQKLDIAAQPLSAPSDLVIASYVMNELSLDQQAETAKKLWEAAGSVLLFVEAGTPEGYQTLMRIRTELTGAGAHVAAPCPHERPCPLPENDWCHFTCRIGRSRLHKLSKGGEAPYEDEKYSYLALVKNRPDCVTRRILRHPQIAKGYVKLDLCAPDGLEQTTVSKKSGELYKKARKAQSGDAI